MGTPKLYSLGFSPTCQRVFATLAHKGVAYDTVDVDITQKERPAEFTAISPFGKVPVLQHDGHTLIESTVICEYIDEVWPEPAMLPKSAAGRAEARQWIQFVNRAIVDRDGEMVHVEREKAGKQALCAKILADLHHLDRALDGRPGLFFGDALSLVDVNIAPFAPGIRIWADLIGDRSLAGLANLNGYFDRLAAVPVLCETVYNVPEEALRGFFSMILVDGATVP